MTEDEELMARIGFLAGQINRHKNQSHHTGRGGYSSAPYGSQHVHHRGSSGWRPYRGRSRGAPRPLPGPHRHRTLIINGQKAGSDSASATPSADVSNDDAPNTKATQKDGWVSKRDRHMQLINTSIYDQETQARQKAIEETMKQKTQKKAEMEKARVLRHAQRTSGPQFLNTTAGNPDAKTYTILVNDIPFKIAQGGGKLIRISSERAFRKDENSRAGLQFLDDPTMANATPKRTKVGGVTFVRSKNGNLHRLGAVVSKKYGLTDGDATRRAQPDQLTFNIRQPMPVKKKSELCKRFTSMGTCFKGPNCPYTHDPSKVAICKEYLQTGKCDAGDACDLSHEPSPERSPACVHFIRGRCSNPTCRYAHVRVTPGAPVCRDFAILGYCSKGSTCEERHVHECPDYANTGKCDTKRCPLPHIDRAGQIRKLASTNKTDTGASDEDISSEEEAYDEIDSDDIDSDEYDEPEIITSKPDTGEVSEQKDFIGF